MCYCSDTLKLTCPKDMSSKLMDVRPPGCQIDAGIEALSNASFGPRLTSTTLSLSGENLNPQASHLACPALSKDCLGLHPEKYKLNAASAISSMMGCGVLSPHNITSGVLLHHLRLPNRRLRADPDQLSLSESLDPQTYSV